MRTNVIKYIMTVPNKNSSIDTSIEYKCLPCAIWEFDLNSEEQTTLDNAESILLSEQEELTYLYVWDNDNSGHVHFLNCSRCGEQIHFGLPLRETPEGERHIDPSEIKFKSGRRIA